MFQYTNGLSFKLRGTPADGAYLAHNIFPKSESDSVHQNETGMVLGSGPNANTFDRDTFGEYGVCDFDADGMDDLFLATGINWWYMSGASRHWVFLRDSGLRLNQVGLGDFDADGQCDVLSVEGPAKLVGMYAGGKANWSYLHVSGIPFDQLRFGHFGGTPRSDMFRRAPDGQWSLVSATGSTPLASSPLPLNELHVADFNGDHVSDVIARVDGNWVVSWGGRTPFQTLNTNVSDSLDSVFIADLDGNGGTDVLRYIPETPFRGRWDVSWAGQTPWTTYATFEWPSSVASMDPAPAASARTYVGHFSATPGGQLLMVDYSRMGKVFSRAAAAFVPQAEYAY